VMSDSEDSTVTYTAVSSPFGGLSDIGSLGVDGPPVMLEDPYAYVIAADKCTDKTKITRKPSKTGKHGHENERVYKSRKLKSKSQPWSSLSQLLVNSVKPQKDKNPKLQI
ncbi:hypothetical protein Tco_0101122, partial [Tanacetum coccineum]